MSDAWQISASSRTLRQLSGDLFAFFRHRLNQTEDARDLVSQTWLAAGKNYKHLSSLRYFVFQVAQNTLLGHWRRQLRKPSPSSADVEQLRSPIPGPERALLIAEWGHAANEALQAVPVQFRSVVELWLRGFSRKEIAERLDINPNTVRSRLSRGRKYFFAALSRSSRSIVRQ